MRLSRLVGLGAAFALPFFAVAAANNNFGPIIPIVIQTCPAGWQGLTMVVGGLLSFAISLGIIIAVLMFAYAGFLWVLNPASPENRGTGRKILINAAIGLVLTLSAWLIVNTLLNVLGVGGIAGATSELFKGGAPCITQTSGGGGGGGAGGGGLTTGGGGGGGTGANCPDPGSGSMVALPASVVAGGSGLATPTTVQNFLAMRAAALQAGIDLKVTSAYRSDAEQLNQYNAVGGNTALAAKPCSLGGPGSNHTSGTALDLTDGCTRGVPNCNTSAYNWLKANGSRWSFNNALPLDLIHWSPSGH